MRESKRATGKRSGNPDLARIDATTDAEIAQQIADDPDTSPEWTDEMFAEAKWVQPAKRVPIALRIDPVVLEHFRSEGPGYQSRINAVLEAYVARARGASGGR